MTSRPVAHALTLMIAVIALTFSGPVLAQDRGGEGDRPRMTREQWENMSDEEREAFREEMRGRMAERQAEREQEQRSALEMTEEEWELIGPKIIAIRQMQQQQMMVSTGGRGFGGRDRGGRGGFGGGGELSEEAVAIQEATAELRELLEDEAASSTEIKDALGALREARTVMADKLRDAQEDLRGLLTSKQEAMLVAQGILS
ncbi:MAG: hypothetical protein AAGC44_06230 [Planctomycetota bacterium]